MTDRAKTNRFASDDQAGDLLADILESTEEEARAEQVRIENSLAARRDAAERSEAEAHAARIADRQMKLERELERQDELAKRRTQRMQALKAPATPPAEAPAPEKTPTLDEAAIRRQIAEEVREELRAIGMTPMPEPVEPPQIRRASRPGILAAAAGVLIAGGFGIAMLVAQASYSPDPNPYAKAVFAPMDHNAVALEMSSTPIPKAEVVVVVEESAKPAAKTRPAAAKRPTPKEHRPSSVFNQKVKTSEERSAYDRLQDALGDSTVDPFSTD